MSGQAAAPAAYAVVAADERMVVAFDCFIVLVDDVDEDVEIVVDVLNSGANVPVVNVPLPYRVSLAPSVLNVYEDEALTGELVLL